MILLTLAKPQSVTDADSTPKKHDEIFKMLLGELQTVTDAYSTTPKKHDEVFKNLI